METANLFTMLSAYRPGSAATPFENYCTSGLAYLLRAGHARTRDLFAGLADAGSASLDSVEVQPQLADAGFADLLLSYDGGRRVVVEVQVEAGADDSHLPGLEEVARTWDTRPGFVLVGLSHEGAPAGWRALTWSEIAEALAEDPDPIAREFSEFVRRDVLGFGPVPLDQALSTNRLYALGAAAVRRHFGEDARYENSASPPVGGRYRYLGTTFAPDGGDLNFWIGVVNEALPLSEHYHLMLASKHEPLEEPAGHPRATGNWSWAQWTGMGRVVRPVGLPEYEELLSRIRR